MLELFSLQLCLFFSNKIMKFYKGICSVWTSRTPVECFFSQIDVISVLKKQQKYLRSIKRHFSGFFQTDLMGGISSAIQKLRKYLKDTVVLTLAFIIFKMAKHTLTILRCSPQDFKSMFGHFKALWMKGLTSHVLIAEQCEVTFKLLWFWIY